MSASGRRVVLVHRYFAPDTPPYANMLYAIAASLAERGHSVTVLTCQPSYRPSVVSRAPRFERVSGFDVVRWPVLDDRSSSPRKLLNLVWFVLRLVFARRYFRGADVVMAATTPPIAIALVASFIASAFRADFIYHKQDIWPEVANVGSTGLRGRLLRILQRVDHWTERRAARVVVLSTDMAKTVRARSSHDVRTVVLNNFDPWPLEVSSASLDGVRSGPLALVFAGNLGHFQGIELLLDLIARLGDVDDIRWHFFGDGPLSDLVAASANRAGPRITFHGYSPAHTVAKFMRDEADLGIIVLNPGVIRAAYPSKTMSYLRNGLPLLAMVETDSELAQMIFDEGIGFAGSVSRLDRLESWLRATVADPLSVRAARDSARHTYTERFDQPGQLEKWCLLFEEVGA